MHLYTLRTSDRDESVMKTQARWGSRKLPKREAELCEANEEAEGHSSLFAAQKHERLWCV